MSDRVGVVSEIAPIAVLRCERRRVMRELGDVIVVRVCPVHTHASHTSHTTACALLTATRVGNQRGDAVLNRRLFVGLFYRAQDVCHAERSSVLGTQ